MMILRICRFFIAHSNNVLNQLCVSIEDVNGKRRKTLEHTNSRVDVCCRLQLNDESIFRMVDKQRKKKYQIQVWHNLARRIKHHKKISGGGQIVSDNSYNGRCGGSSIKYCMVGGLHISRLEQTVVSLFGVRVCMCVYMSAIGK